MMRNIDRRRLVLALAAGGAGIALGGCAGAPAQPRQRQYSETISSVLVSQDDKHLVAIGRDHYYVFDAPAPLARALHSPVHTQLTAVFTPFHVDAKADITGEVTLQLPADASAEAQRMAAELGLVRQGDGSWQASSRLAGHRYSSWTYRAPDQKREKLGKTYTIDITADEGLADTAVDKAVTPLRVTADGVEMIYYAALAPIIIPFIFLARARDR